jgi:hypothetical protein
VVRVVEADLALDMPQPPKRQAIQCEDRLFMVDPWQAIGHTYGHNCRLEFVFRADEAPPPFREPGNFPTSPRTPPPLGGALEHRTPNRGVSPASPRSVHEEKRRQPRQMRSLRLVPQGRLTSIGRALPADGRMSHRRGRRHSAHDPTPHPPFGV